MKVLSFRNMAKCAKLPVLLAAVVGLAIAPVAWADDDDWGDDPGWEPDPGTPDWCDWYGHDFVEIVDVEPTCTTPGHSTSECANCGEIRDADLPALGHDYKNGVCTRCGQSQSGQGVTYNHIGYVSETCTTAGNIEYWLGSDGKYYDAVGGNELSESDVFIAALGHDWGEWTGITPATCTIPGEKTHTCTRAGCGVSETQQIAALGHSWGAWTEITPATCTIPGEETHTCTRAGCGVSETQPIAALGHNYVGGVCTRCNDGLAYSFVPAVSPTCTIGGNVAYWLGSDGKYYDADGGNELPESDVFIAALGHDWGAWTTTTPATFTIPGEEARACARAGCTAHETRAIPTLQHSTFTLKSSTSGTTTTFSIYRSGAATNLAETVRYRTTSLSALAGVHFTAVTGTVTFAAGVTNRTVAVTQTPIGNIATQQYRYQTGTSRTYRFEINGWDGVELVHADQSINYGSSYQFKADKVSAAVTNLVYFNGINFASGLASSKYAQVSYTPPSSDVEQSGNYAGYALIDDSYNYKNKAATVSTATLISSTGVSANYLDTLSYKIYATVCFTMKEKNDGYQFVQILAGDSSAAYDGADDNAKVNDPVNSLYKACFELKKGSGVYDDAGKQFYPHRYDYVDRTAGGQTSSNTEFYLDSSYLWQHKFKSASYRASTSGSLVLPVTTAYITTRFDCCGADNDTWGYKDFFVRMALVDATKPTLLNNGVAAIAVNPGPHYRGGTFYISVPFSEIVTVTGTPTLTTSWGTASYTAGTGSNVLTFKGTITAEEGTELEIRSRSGTIKDLVGNVFVGSMNKTFAGTVVEMVPWTGAGTASDPYVITTTSQLNCLAARVNAGNSCANTCFILGADIAYAHASDWNASSTENNYAAIGYFGHSFQGKFDGRGHVVSGIRIYKSGSTNNDGSQGLFGYLGSGGGRVCNVILADARITGYVNCGAIVGFNSGTLATNYYRDVSVNGATTNIGTGTAGDLPGARSLHTLALADGISIVGAEASVAIANATYYAAGSAVTLAYGGTPPPVGYGLAGYTVDGVDFDGGTITMPAADSAVDVRFSPVTYSISYDLAGGRVATANPVTYTVTTASFTLNNPTRPGFSFAGWTGASPVRQTR